METEEIIQSDEDVPEYSFPENRLWAEVIRIAHQDGRSLVRQAKKWKRLVDLNGPLPNKAFFRFSDAHGLLRVLDQIAFLRFEIDHPYFSDVCHNAGISVHVVRRKFAMMFDPFTSLEDHQFVIECRKIRAGYTIVEKEIHKLKAV